VSTFTSCISVLCFCCYAGAALGEFIPLAPISVVKINKQLVNSV